MIQFGPMVDMSKPMIPDFKGSPVTFLKEVQGELKKVTWPTKDEIIKLTGIVVVVSVVVGLYIGGLDFVFTKMMDLLIK